MRGRVKGLFGGTSPDNELPDQVPPTLAESDAQRQALQVLTLAQRTADDHVATAHRQADKIRADARAQAEQIVREAQAHAGNARREAEKALTDARATAEKLARDAQAHAAETRRDADMVLADARVRAEEIAKDAEANADALERQAQQRYQEVVGGLAAKREALQEQIEALQQFDRDYRNRLTTFMQSQLRALWVDAPPDENDQQGSGAAAGPPVPAQSREEKRPAENGAPRQRTPATG